MDNELQGSPGLRKNGRGSRPDIITIQGKLPKEPTEVEKAHFAEVKKAIDHFTNMPWGEDGDGRPLTLGRAWGNFHVLKAVHKGIQKGELSVEKLKGFLSAKPAAPKAKAAPKPKAKKAAPKKAQKKAAKAKAKAPAKKPKAATPELEKAAAKALGMAKK